MRIKGHPGICLGYGECRRWAPNVYTLDDEGYLDLDVAEVPPELRQEALLGAEVCPERAITVMATPDEPRESGSRLPARQA